MSYKLRLKWVMALCLSGQGFAQEQAQPVASSVPEGQELVSIDFSLKTLQYTLHLVGNCNRRFNHISPCPGPLQDANKLQAIELYAFGWYFS